MENNMNKILKLLYVIIALLVLNTIILVAPNIKITADKATEKTNETTEYDVSMFKQVSGTEAVEAFGSSDVQVLYLGRETCGYCVKFLPTLQKAQKEYGYKTLYLDITTVTSDEQSALLEKDNDEGFLQENYGATPMVLLVKDGKMVDTWVGYNDYDSFAQFLEKNGFKK